jgi:uncharacterized protein
LTDSLLRLLGLAAFHYLRGCAAALLECTGKTSAESLDPGETAAIALALEIRADAVLVDERRGHQVARQFGLTTISLIGIVLRAKAAGLLPRLAPVLDTLRTGAQFWISEQLRAELLRLAGED